MLLLLKDLDHNLGSSYDDTEIYYEFISISYIINVVLPVYFLNYMVYKE